MDLNCLDGLRLSDLKDFCNIENFTGMKLYYIKTLSIFAKWKEGCSHTKIILAKRLRNEYYSEKRK